MKQGNESDIKKVQSVKINAGDFPQEIRFSSRSSFESGQSWGSEEHTDVGNIVVHLFFENLKKTKNDDAANFLKLLGDNCKSGPVALNTYNPFKEGDDKFEMIHPPVFRISDKYEHGLQAGGIVALAGDFIGIPEKPIAFGKDDADKKARFLKAFRELTDATPEQARMYSKIASKFKSNNLREELSSCFHCAVFEWILTATEPLYKNDIVDTITYQIQMTPNSASSVTGHIMEFYKAKYFHLLLGNFDHFGAEAKIAYMVGHLEAIEKVKLAKVNQDTNLLIEGILMELFACHFLQDLFAGGHIRTPRKKMLNHLTRKDGKLDEIPDLENNSVSTANLAAAGFFANQMHNRDGEKGVNVRSVAFESSWRALGDGNYFAPENQENARYVCKTMLIALEDLFRAFCGQKAVLSNLDELDKYLPQPIETKDNPPMFYEKDGKIFMSLDTKLLENVQQKGLIKGTTQTFKDGVPLIGNYLGYYGIQIFNVKLKPAIVKGIDTVADFVEATDEALQNLYDKLEENASKINCNIL